MEPIKLPKYWECIKEDGLQLYINTKEDLICYFPPMHLKDLSLFMNTFNINKEALNKMTARLKCSVDDKPKEIPKVEVIKEMLVVKNDNQSTKEGNKERSFHDLTKDNPAALTKQKAIKDHNKDNGSKQSKPLTSIIRDGNINENKCIPIALNVAKGKEEKPSASTESKNTDKPILPKENIIEIKEKDKLIKENGVNTNTLLGNKRKRDRADHIIPDNILTMSLENENIVLNHLEDLCNYTPVSVSITYIISRC
jgi:hypothetical protein